MIFNRLMSLVNSSLPSLLNPSKCLPGRSDTNIPRATNPGTRHVFTKNPLLGPFPENFQIATFGMGCFWCSEGHFATLAKTSPGIYITRVGYSQGVTENPTYEEVCSGRTNHNEVVQIVFDPTIRPYESLLKDFWELHDPTTPMRQGNDSGTQYRSGIYTQSAEQKEIAVKSKELYQEALTSRGINAEIVTEIQDLEIFYPAEEYHQQYDHKPGSRQYCGLRPTGVAYQSPNLSN